MRVKCDQYPEGHGPGPPHRPHIPGADDAAAPVPAEDFAPPVAPTANTLSARAVRLEPHAGHFTFASPLSFIVRCNCSNFASHDLHVYS